VTLPVAIVDGRRSLSFIICLHQAQWRNVRKIEPAIDLWKNFICTQHTSNKKTPFTSLSMEELPHFRTMKIRTYNVYSPFILYAFETLSVPVELKNF